MPEKKDLTVENGAGNAPETGAGPSVAEDAGKEAFASPDKKTGADSAGNAQTGKQQAKGPATTPPGRKTRLIPRMFLVLVLCGLGAGAYYLYRYGTTLDNPILDNSIVDRLRGRQAEPAAAAKSLPQDAPAVTGPGDSQPVANAIDGRLEQENARLSAEVEILGTRLEDVQLQVNAQQARLQQLSVASREDWLLAEAEYLLRLANQRILTERQTANALSLMLAADAILRDIGDTDLFAVRKALAADITRVKMVGIVDREGIYVRLDGLIQAIPELRVPLRETADEETAAVETPGPGPWYQQLLANARAALVKMSGIVRVERVDVPVDPVMLPSEQQLLHLNLRMALEQAQLALMREEQKIFAASLARADGLVAGSFVNNPQADVFRAEVLALSREKITQPLPDLGAAINALQDYIRLWHGRYPSALSQGAADDGNDAEGQADAEAGADGSGDEQ